MPAVKDAGRFFKDQHHSHAAPHGSSVRCQFIVIVCFCMPRSVRLVRQCSTPSSHSLNGPTMTSEKIQCPHCHRYYNVAIRTLGRTVTCANEACGKKFLSKASSQLESVKQLVPSTPKVTSSSGGRNAPAAPPPLRKTTVTSQPNRIMAISIAAALLMLLGLAVGFVGWKIAVQQFPISSKPEASVPVENADRETAKNCIAELLYLTDATLRFMKISDDSDLAREFIDKWAALRGTVPNSDDTEVSLGVIEGHLNVIHQKMYSSPPESWGKELLCHQVDESRDAIQRAQNQLMKLLKIRWDDAQRSNRYASALSDLRQEGRRIALASEVGKNNLPQPLTFDDAKILIRGLDSLYANVPRETTGLFSSTDRRADAHAVPRDFGISSDSETIHDAASSVILARTTVPDSQRTLQEKTESLKFSEEYSNSLKHLLLFVGDKKK